MEDNHRLEALCVLQELEKWKLRIVTTRIIEGLHLDASANI